MIKEICLVCETLSGKRKSPGGIIYENNFWLVEHTLPPIFIPGQLVIKLKRHCEHLGELSLEESANLGLIIQRVSQAVMQVTAAEKVHVASYGEHIAHIHFLVTPRTSDMPASNIKLVKLIQRRRILHKIGMFWLVKKESIAAEFANQVRETMTPVRFGG